MPREGVTINPKPKSPRALYLQTDRSCCATAYRECVSSRSRAHESKQIQAMYLIRYRTKKTHSPFLNCPQESVARVTGVIYEPRPSTLIYTNPATFIGGGHANKTVLFAKIVPYRGSVDAVMMDYRVTLATLVRKKSGNDGSDYTADYSLG